MKDIAKDHRAALQSPAAQREAREGAGSLSAQMSNSPRQLAQRRQIGETLGAAVQRVEGPMEADDGTAARSPVAAGPRQQNRTGMPDALKAGIETLSGMDMSEVRVHHNSDQPAQLNALAYAQGNDIHLAPGQEQHLPHEAWHVVQQRQGRVRPTTQVGDVAVNNDESLESEADRIGAQAASQPLHDLGPSSPVQARADGAVPETVQAQGGRRAGVLESGFVKVIKFVMPGSGFDDWITHTDKADVGTRRPGKKVVSDKDDKHGGQVVIGGPNAKGGASDTGQNSIENNVSFGLEEFGNQIQGIAQGSVLLMIKAHSRNAVAATRLATAIKSTHQKNGLYVNIDLVLFDPVPGPGHSGEDVEIDIGSIDQSTLVYSVASGWGVGFSPQRVLGANRIIVTRQNHQGGIKAGFLFRERIYKGNRLNYLPEGIYVDNNQQGEATKELKRVYSLDTMREQWAALYKSSNAYKGDSGRKESVDQVIRDKLSELTEVAIQQ